jgi:hypothetical protein
MSRFVVCGFWFVAAATLGAQGVPTSIATSIPVRPIGAKVRSSAVTFSSVQHVRRLSDGRLLVNDPGRRQIVLLDSTLANPVVVIDSVGGHDNSYGLRAGGLLPFRGDSTVFADPTSQTLLIIDPSGRIARVMSMPGPSAISYLTSPSSYGHPGYSEAFGIVFRRNGPGLPWPTSMPPEGAPEVVIKGEDSSLVVALNVSTRKMDTLARLSVGEGSMMRISYNNVNQTSFGDLYPIPDDWTLAADGSIALLGGREYRVRWINPDRSRTESPRLPFTWFHVDDDEKVRLADSINAGREKAYQDRVDAQKRAIAAAEAAKASGAPPGPNGPPRPPSPPNRPTHIDQAEIPDYMPAYERSASSFRGDADNNLWIRPKPSRGVSGGPIYDVVNRKGELFDRVQLPAGRTLIGFGPGGIVYLVVRDAGATRIEQVRFRNP